jgi:hypothetical protein
LRCDASGAAAAELKSAAKVLAVQTRELRSKSPASDARAA